MMEKNALQANEVASSWEIVQRIPVDLRSINIKLFQSFLEKVQNHRLMFRALKPKRRQKTFLMR
jgi:hypothetical protein